MNRILASAVVASLLAPAAVSAQADFVLKSDSKFLHLFAECITQAANGTVRVKSEGKDVALGTIVEADGWVVTKASQLEKLIIVRLRDGKELPAKVLAVHDQYDLALLKVDAKDWKPVQFTISKVAMPGHWVAATGVGGDPVAVGVVSAPTRTLSTRELAFETNIPQGGYLGIQMEPVEGGKGVRIVQVMPNTAASKAGLKKDDVILKIEGQEIDEQKKVFDVLSKTRPGDVVKMVVQREDEEVKLSATLGKRPS